MAHRLSYHLLLVQLVADQIFRYLLINVLVSLLHDLVMNFVLCLLWVLRPFWNFFLERDLLLGLEVRDLPCYLMSLRLYTLAFDRLTGLDFLPLAAKRLLVLLRCFNRWNRLWLLQGNLFLLHDS